MTSFIAVHLWQSSLVLAAAWALTVLCRRNGAELRFLIWCGASLKFLVLLAALQWLGDRLGQNLPQPLAVDPLLMETANAFFMPSLPSSNVLSSAMSSWLAMLAVAIWACGALLLAWRWLLQWRALRSVLGASHSLPMALPVPVYVTRSDGALGVFGIFRPVVLMPESVLRALDPQQLAAVLAHELCHVERRDNLFAAIHQCVQTLFWFNPLVWWVGTQLLREREAACDECVVEGGHDRRVYAESILAVCRSSVVGRFPASPAAGGDLAQRVFTIMSRSAAQPIDNGRFSLLLGLVTCVCFAPLISGIVAGADRAAASDVPIVFHDLIWDSADPNARSSTSFDPAGSLTLNNVSLRQVIRSAYPAAIVSGDPYVIDVARYDIRASWYAEGTVFERAAYRELLRKIVPRNVQLLVNGECELTC